MSEALPGGYNLPLQDSFNGFWSRTCAESLDIGAAPGHFTFGQTHCYGHVRLPVHRVERQLGSQNIPSQAIY
jgi:hypothetical protein